MEAWVILFTMRPCRLPRPFSLLSERASDPGYPACILIALRNAFRSESGGGDSSAPEVLACKTWSILLNKFDTLVPSNLVTHEHYDTDPQFPF
jgi:hypothetical protein